MHLTPTERIRFGDLRLPKPALIAIVSVLIAAVLLLTFALYWVVRRTLKSARDDEANAIVATGLQNPQPPPRVSNAV